MAGKGGYQKPKNPAPVSGPGSMSKRTDGGPADPQPSRHIPTDDWGGSQEMDDIQSSAPMSGGPARPLKRLDAPDDRPDVPVTSGANAGPGMSLTELMSGITPDPSYSQAPVDEAAAIVRAVYAVQPSRSLQALMNQLEKEGL